MNTLPLMLLVLSLSSGSTPITHVRVAKQDQKVNESTPGKGTIQEACAESNLIKVKAMLAADKSLVNKPDRAGMTALLWAVYPYALGGSKAPEVVSFLLSKGANVNYQHPKHGWTPLHRLFDYGSFDSQPRVASLLMQKGANPKLLTKDGDSVLDYAFNHAHAKATRDAIDIIFPKGIELSKMNKEGVPLLLRDPYILGGEGSDERMAWLRKHKAEFTIKTKNGMTAIHLIMADIKSDVGSSYAKEVVAWIQAWKGVGVNSEAIDSAGKSALDIYVDYCLQSDFVPSAPVISALHNENNRKVALSNLDLSPIITGWKKPGRNVSCESKPLIFNGKTYKSGVGGCPNFIWDIELNGKGSSFEAIVGINDYTPKGRGSVQFVVEADGKEVFDSGVLRAHEETASIKVDLKGVKLLRLIERDGGDGITSDHGDWCDAFITMIDGSFPKSIPIKD